MRTHGAFPIIMVSPDGREVEFLWHPNVAGQMRLYYERKGWVLKPEPAPEPEPKPVQAEVQTEEPAPKRKRGLQAQQGASGAGASGLPPI